MDVETPKRLGARIEAGEPAIGGDPQDALVILDDGADPVSDQPVTLGVVNESAGRFIEPIQPPL